MSEHDAGRGTSRRSRAGTVIGVIVALLVLFCALSLLSLSSVRTRVVDRAREIAARLASASGVRPPLRGQPTEGNAWQYYRRALEQIGDEGGDGPALAALRAGAACGVARFERPLHAGASLVCIDVLAAIELVDHAVQRVVGDPVFEQRGAGVGLLLDCALFGRDLMAAGTLVEQMAGAVAIRNVLDVVGDEARLTRWPVAMLRRLARELAVLDEEMPDLALPYEVEACVGGFAGVGAPPFAGMASSWWGKVAFSVLGPHAADENQRAMLRVREAARAGWQELERVTGEVRAELSASINPMTRVFYSPATAQMCEPRRVVAKLRVLRQLAHLAAGGGDLGLESPFGGGLLIEKREGEVRVEAPLDDGAAVLVVPAGALRIPGTSR